MIGEKEFIELKDEIAEQMIENLPVAIRCVVRRRGSPSRLVKAV